MGRTSSSFSVTTLVDIGDLSISNSDRVAVTTTVVLGWNGSALWVDSLSSDCPGRMPPNKTALAVTIMTIGFIDSP